MRLLAVQASTRATIRCECWKQKKKHTEQVARQAATQQALLCAENLTSCALHRPDLCELIIVTLPNATTARDLSPSRPARKSAHRKIASNNLSRLQRIIARR